MVYGDIFKSLPHHQVSVKERSGASHSPAQILGPVTADKIALLQAADASVPKEIATAGLERGLCQAFAVLLPVRSDGVLSDNRTCEHTCAIRGVTSTGGLTADWAHLPYAELETISNRTINEVRGSIG